jgi:hypothetical protein
MLLDSHYMGILQSNIEEIFKFFNDKLKGGFRVKLVLLYPVITLWK